MNLVPMWEYLNFAKDRFGAGFALSRYPRALSGLVKVPAGTGHVYLRSNNFADWLVYDEVFRDRAYGMPWGNPRTIIDAGANIGLTSVFLAQLYPNAMIIAIEPEEANFRMLERHARMHPNIKPVKAGLWSRQTRLKIVNSDGDSWGFRVAEDPNGFDAVTIESLMRDFRIERIDVLKIDIEGSEVEVMDHSSGWIDRVGAMVIETHDRYNPRSTESVNKATGFRPWKRFKSGENEVFLPMAA